jgi:hypothetical protein
MRLPHLNQEAIKIQPLPEVRCANGLLDIGTDTAKDQAVRDMNLDLSKISVFRRDGSECLSDPFDAPWVESELHVCELRRVREVDRR